MPTNKPLSDIHNYKRDYVCNPDPAMRNLARIELVKRAIRKDPWIFFREYVYTLDPHNTKSPVSKFPDMPYLQETLAEIAGNNMVLVEKSRQMMITWLCIGYALYDCLFNQGRYWFLVSRKEESAGLSTPLSLLSRCDFIYQHLPEWMRTGMHFTKQPPIMMFEENKSTLHAVPQDSDALRSYTASGIYADELAFQDKARDMFTAAKPTIMGGGKFVGVSTPNGKNYWYLITQDKEVA